MRLDQHDWQRLNSDRGKGLIDKHGRLIRIKNRPRYLR